MLVEGVEVNSLKSSASESAKIKKARLKLIKYLEKVDRLVTQDGLKKKIQEIHFWIARHAQSRVVLKNKNISLFDENQNAARLSHRVSEILNGLKKDFQFQSQKEDSKFDLKKKVDSSQTN